MCMADMCDYTEEEKLAAVEQLAKTLRVVPIATEGDVYELRIQHCQDIA